MPKTNLQQPKARHDPLHVQITKETESMKPIKHKEKQILQESETVDEKTSKKILKMIREQQNEILEEQEIPAVLKPVKPLKPRKLDVESDEESETDLQDYEEWNQGGDLEIDTNDQELVQKFMNNNNHEKVNISELILSKIEKTDVKENKLEQEPSMNPKVIEVYSKVGLLLSRYKSGPLPKTFKIIPNLRDWEQILAITNPDSWTPQATFQATRIFTSNLKSRMAQRFFNILLLEKVREDINTNKKLNYHLYMALKKSLYKPGAFFKGILLPMLESKNCTLREAAIIASVLVKCSVPVLHSAAALLKIAEMDYTGNNFNRSKFIIYSYIVG